uniref:Uncharacterized protein n=1 Tax=Arundo donax TaxID=35708 RepID=A0A0A8YA79_ARUDO
MKTLFAGLSENVPPSPHGILLYWLLCLTSLHITRFNSSHLVILTDPVIAMRSFLLIHYVT